MAVNFSKYFDSPTFCDVILHYGDGAESIRAHKIVLANKSEQFKASFAADAETTEVGAFHLDNYKHDVQDPVAFRGMIAYLYGVEEQRVKDLEFAASHETADTHDDGFCMHSCRYLRYLIDLHRVASDYELHELEECTAAKFEIYLQIVTKYSHCWKIIGCIAGKMFDEGPADSLREAVVDLFASDSARLSSSAAIKELLLDLPELSVEIVQRLALQNCHISKRRVESMAGLDMAADTVVKRARLSPDSTPGETSLDGRSATLKPSSTTSHAAANADQSWPSFASYCLVSPELSPIDKPAVQAASVLQ